MLLHDLPEGLRVQDESSVDMYIIADLADPFASGSFIDLAYLVTHVVEEEISDRTFSHMTGVLFFPSFRSRESDSEPAEDEILSERQAERMREADAYAALKELDYYMDKGRYEAAYWAQIALESK